MSPGAPDGGDNAPLVTPLGMLVLIYPMIPLVLTPIVF